MGACRLRRALPVSLVAIAFAMASPLLGQQQAPDHDQPDETLPGFKATNVYHDFGSVDHVNIFSGDTGVVIPLGPEYPLSQGLTWQLKAYHSAKMWIYDGHYPGCLGHVVIAGSPTLGAGWNLDLGHVDKSQHAGWFYQSPDGGRHSFGCDGLNSSAVPCPSSSTPQTQYFTFESTHERVTWFPSSNSFSVEFPDGSIQYFNQVYTRPRAVNSSDPSPDFDDQYRIAALLPPGTPPPPDDTRWGLTDYYDRFGTRVLHVNYAADSNSNPWQLSSIVLTPDAPNANARTINFTWTTLLVSNSGAAINGLQTISLNPIWPVLQSIAFPTAAGSLTTTFGFLQGTFYRPPFFNGVDVSSCGPDGIFPIVVAVPLLSSIAMNGSLVSQRWKFSYPSNPTANPPGVLLGVQLPTGGQIQYHYDLTTIEPCPIPQNPGDPGCTVLPSATQTPSIPSRDPVPQKPIGDNFPPYHFTDASPAVVSRKEINADGSTASEATYFRQDFWIPVGVSYSSTQTLRQVDVHRPDGNGGTIADRYQFHVSLPKEVISSDSTGGLELVHYYYNQDVTPLTSPTPIRAVVSCYDADSVSQGVVTGCGYANGTNYTSGDDGVTRYFGANARLQNRVTWYGDNPANSSVTRGGDCNQSLGIPCVQKFMSDYRALNGQYASTTISTASLTSMSSWTSRTTTTNWIGPQGGRWLLNLFSSKTVTDSGPGLPTPSTVSNTFDFDLSNGFLRSAIVTDGTYGTLTRSFLDDAGMEAHDAQWNPTSLKVFGTGGVDARVFKTTREFALGTSLLKSAQRQGLTWKSFDVDRDASTGRITTSRDPNPSLATSYGYDALGRLTRITPPGEAETTITYDDDNRSATVSRSGADGNGAWARYLYDGFGRLIREIKQMPGSNNYAVRTHGYAANGQESFDSEWGSCTDPSSSCLTTSLAGTTYSYFDPFGRARQILKADGSFSAVDFTDFGIYQSDTLQRVTTQVNTGAVPISGFPQTAATTWVRKDVVGRAISVTEPSGDVTSYQYNALDKLAQVTQGVQNRTFVYDSFGFLRSEIHPEKGETDYSTYDALGNVLTKLDGGITTQYTYDAAGRLGTVATGTVYSLTCYLETTDCPGGLPVSSNPNGKVLRAFGYNPFLSGGPCVREDFDYAGPGGRLSTRTTAFSTGEPPPLTESFFYNSLGLMRGHVHPRDATAATFPFVVATEYDQGLPVREYLNGLQLVKAVSYQPSGALASYTTGLGMNLDVTTTIDRDGDLPRPKRIHASRPSDGNTLFDTGSYLYDGSGNISAINFDVFGYDPRTRLAHAELPWNGPKQDFTYDQYGNMTARAGVNAQSFGIDPSTNHISGYDYLRGNLTGPTGSPWYEWDDLDRLAYQGFGPWHYLYNAENERTGKQSSAAGWTFTLRDSEKRVSTEFSGSTPSRDNAFLGNLLVASYANVNVGANNWSWSFYSSDHLGTPRYVSYMQVADSDSHKYWPYGDEVTPQTEPQRLRFAAMEADDEATRFYDHARHHDFGLARFLSADQLGGRPTDAQSWNRYAYARNNPLKYLDPDGRFTVSSFAFASALANGNQAAANLAQWAPAYIAGMAAAASGLSGLFGLGAVVGAPSMLLGARFLGPAAAPVLQKAGETVEPTVEKLTNAALRFDPGTILNDANKVGHFFDSKHNLDVLGSRVEAVAKISDAVQQAYSEGALSLGEGGKFQQVIQVGKQQVEVQGRVIEDVLKIGNAWIRSIE